MGLLTIVLCGCTTLQQLIDKPDVEFRGMSLASASLFEATPVFRFELNNPNPMGLLIRSVTYNLKINDKKFVRGVSDQNVLIKAANSGILELPLTFDYLDVFESIASFRQSDTVSYELAGSIGIGPFSLPYQADGEFDIPELPDVSLEGVQVENMSISGASLVVDLNVENNNSFPIDMGGLNYSLKLEGRELAQGMTRQISSISEKGMARIRIPVSVNFLELGQSAYQALRGKATDYEVAGEMTFNMPGQRVKRIPFEKSGEVRLQR